MQENEIFVLGSIDYILWPIRMALQPLTFSIFHYYYYYFFLMINCLHSYFCQTIIHDPRLQPSFSPLAGENKVQDSSQMESYKEAIKGSLPLSPPQSPDTKNPLAVTLEEMPADGEEQEDQSLIQSAVFYSITSTQKGA